MKSMQLSVKGASCASCVKKIETALINTNGVSSAQMNFADRTVSVEGVASPESLIKAIEAIGYKASLNAAQSNHLFEQEQQDQKYYNLLIRKTYIALALGVPLMLYGVLGGNMQVSTDLDRIVWLVIGLLTLMVMVYSGRHFYLGAWKSFVHHSANMDTLIALGTGTSWLYSMAIVIAPTIFPEMAKHVYFEATAMILGLLNLGLALELRARGKTSQAIKRLIGLQPKTATVIRHNESLEINIEDVVAGDRVKVRPGEKVAVDGIVVEGSSFVDESMLTGEPIPINKEVDDEVVAGTINKSGMIIFKALRVGKDTALARIIELVKQAQNSKPSIGRLADVISSYFVPTVMIIAILSALLWLNFGPEPVVVYAVISATTVLIIACPCALGLATPMSVMVGVGKAAESGVLIRNGEALQTSSKITTMVVDKTGTITEGMPKMTDFIVVNGMAREMALQLAASLESSSEHPLAEAIVTTAKAQGIKLVDINGFTSITGLGVKGGCDDKKLLLGNHRLMSEQQIDVSAHQETVQALASQAKTVMYFAINGEMAALIAVADPVKDDSKSALSRLQGDGIRIVMLTGDNPQTAKAVADSVGISEYLAEVLPEDKADKVRMLQAQGEVVGMTGDGINDAPALALADVGFAIGSGTDIAMESADVTLMRSSLHGLADAIAISKATLRNIKQNLFAAFIYNIAGIPVAAGLLYPFSGILLSPVIAGAAMAFSSLTVVSNANRLRLFKPMD
ncbi:heavy metal translocating P-type ATPase [Thalassotalea mangrovi]|uniref:Copper-exporting P-type ATPase n=1 Tax=Thalassotalea mangrovi TaxID=2572245 RepID=A0A4U1BAJ4_9GAMM|nr:heavy metal translocating P-type ATPase [Thalassotalea mangrovi]TKB47435.1 copper-translocating P-type ATPase [Thalassotalea mangrovi]